MESTNSARYGTSTGLTFDGREGAPANTPMVDNNGDCGGYTFIKALLSNEEIRTLYQQKWNAFVKMVTRLKAYMEEYATLIEPSAKRTECFGRPITAWIGD